LGQIELAYFAPYLGTLLFVGFDTILYLFGGLENLIVYTDMNWGYLNLYAQNRLKEIHQNLSQEIELMFVQVTQMLAKI
jgi:hypothetical protein